MNNKKLLAQQEPPILVADMDDEHMLTYYWRILMRYKWGILSLAVVGFIIGLVQAYTAVPVYKASATLLVEPAQPKFVNIQSLEGATPITLFYETQYEIIRSRNIAETVVDELKLVSRDSFLGIDPNLEDSNKTGLSEWMPESLRDWFAAAVPMGNQDISDIDVRRNTAVTILQTNLSVQGGQKSQIVVISYEDTDPKQAAEIANAFAKAYSQYGMESRLATVREATNWLSGRLKDLRSQLEQSERELQVFQTREAMVDTENRKRILDTKMYNLATQLVNAQSERAEIEIQYQQIVEARQKGKSYTELVPLLDSPIVDRMLQDFSLLQRKFSELSERYGNKHPKILAAKADRDEAERRLEMEINRVADALFKTYEAAASRERDAKHQIEEQQAEMRSVSGKAFQQAKLEREVESNRQLYDTFLARFKEVDSTADSEQTNVRVIDTAKPPEFAFQPNKKRILLVSLILGLFAGIAMALLRVRLDNTIKRVSDIEEKLRLPVLSELIKVDAKGAMPERFVLSDGKAAFSEAVNQIRTGIMFSNLDNPIKTLAITSSQQGEGKTTLSSNLALSFAMLGKTLLIDADLRMPDIRRVTGLERGAGLTEYVAATHTLEDCCRADLEAPNLFVMTTGELPPNPLEMLSSKTFKHAFDKLKKNFDFIIIDTPPVLNVSDAIVIGHIADSVIVTVKFDMTTYGIAEEMLKRLRHNNIEPLGAVLSMLDIHKVKRYYGNHYYGTYYGSYYGETYGVNAKA